MLCKQCKKETENPNFCSRSCSSSFNNKLNPKRKPEHQCKSCQAPIAAGPYYCSKCSPKNDYLDDGKTLEEVTYTKHHRSSAYCLVRTRARAVAKKLGWKSCTKCGYDKHIEIAHIKAIGEFDKTTPIRVINDPSNLLALCPNCHWEHDHK